VLAEAAGRGLAVTRLDDALTRHEAAPAPTDGLPVTSWGRPRTLATWSGPEVAELAFAARDAELRVLSGRDRPRPRALRELLALQSSDWAFMVSRSLAGPYPVERSDGHARAFEEALAAVGSRPPEVRHLAPDLSLAPLLSP